MKDFCQFLKQARLNAGLSQGNVAAKLGYSTPQFISNWERGLASPPMSAIKTLATIYKIPLDVFHDEILEHQISQFKRELQHELYGTKAKKSGKAAADKKPSHANGSKKISHAPRA